MEDNPNVTEQERMEKEDHRTEENQNDQDEESHPDTQGVETNEGAEEDVEKEEDEVVNAHSPTHDGRESLKDGYVQERVDEFESKGEKGEDPQTKKAEETSGDPKTTIEKFGVTLRPNLPKELKNSTGHLFVPLEGVLAKESEARFTRGRNKPRYFVLTPQFLGYYHKQEQAEIDEEGYMHGVCNLEKLKKMSKAGACIPLTEISNIVCKPQSSQFDLQLDDGGTIRLTAESPECAKLWIASINEWRNHIILKKDNGAGEVGEQEDQKPQRKASIFQRLRGSKQESTKGRDDEEEEAHEEEDSNEKSPPRKRSVFMDIGHGIWSGGKKLGHALMQELETKREHELQAKKERDESFEVFPYRSPTEPRLGSKRDDVVTSLDKNSGGKLILPAPSLVNSTAAERQARAYKDAAILHGWLTKVDSTVLGAGGKDRYFVLTPSYLSFFRNPTDASITDGWFVTGKLSSSKDVGTLSHSGVKIPLELIGTVNVVQRQETKKHDGDEDTDSDEIDEEDKPQEYTHPGKDSSAAAGGNGVGKEWETVEMETNMLEIDAGDVVLTVDCHNKPTRDVWLESLQGWCKIRKNVISEQTFDNFGAVAQYRMLDQAYHCHDDGAKNRKRSSATRNSKTGNFFGSKTLTK
eukprot:gb/GECG01004734.1/.p1 GENE.gb/GECG01004734.1/~~gb/GECG01004734.1/.p1  ORF type:complete len:637 (+),score=138.83 gb/GECG01004734.1/:1-1911(+)